jgi:5-methyltetrahydropteroyltriglutamate--homocysteine methyltransferase
MGMSSTASIGVNSLGFPRIGPARELKSALENYWAGKSSERKLLDVAQALRAANWGLQHARGVTHLPSNDFSLYDQVLDTTAMVGAIPKLYEWKGGQVSLDTYFTMARGSTDKDMPALEMTKWFDTNYHYMVPELARGQEFSLGSTKPIDEFLEAKALGFSTRPVLVGPITYLGLSKCTDPSIDPMSMLPGILPVYEEVLRRLSEFGAEWVQIDEPLLTLDLKPETQNAYQTAFDHLALAAPALKLLLTTYFGALEDNLLTALRLPVAGIHLDLVRVPHQIDQVIANAPARMILSLGVVDGRNVWRTDLNEVLDRIEPVAERWAPEKVTLAPSCSLLHVPLDLEREIHLSSDLRSWLAFAIQKVDELSTLARALHEGREVVEEILLESACALAVRKQSKQTHDPLVRDRLVQLTSTMCQRHSGFEQRRALQHQRLALPAFPTTTIGSFPQTEKVRKARAAYGKGAQSEADYKSNLRDEISSAIHWQEEIGLDVLVHGEFERNDMVQYFGEQLAGFGFTQHGWVQSYGSRYVRPPIIFGDVSRPKPMTTEWAAYAQSLTAKPIKGMITGPVTMMQWSFVRDDIPRSTTCRQIALALRDEVVDLEGVGIRIIQIDEPALREGLPLRRADWQNYLDWAVESFRLTASGVSDETQIHTHMCYSEFNDIIHFIAAMDADVISIETARSKMELLEAFASFHYPNEIGPGVYDIHAPRCPSVAEIELLLLKAKERLTADQIWVNPDCGLKTRKWSEVTPALVNMVAAAIRMRAS